MHKTDSLLSLDVSSDSVIFALVFCFKQIGYISHHALIDLIYQKFSVS